MVTSWSGGALGGHGVRSKEGRQDRRVPQGMLNGGPVLWAQPLRPRQQSPLGDDADDFDDGDSAVAVLGGSRMDRIVGKYPTE